MGCSGNTTGTTQQAAQSDVPAVFRAREEHFLQGLQNMAPGMGKQQLTAWAKEIKAANDTLLQQQGGKPPGPRPGPPPMPSPGMRPGVNTDLIDLQRLTRLGRWWSFLRAVVPWWLGFRTSPEVAAGRKKACMTSGPDGGPCPFAMQHGLSLRCAPCGCPDRPVSDLGNRVNMPLDRCLAHRWPGEGPVISWKSEEKGDDSDGPESGPDPAVGDDSDRPDGATSTGD